MKKSRKKNDLTSDEILARIASEESSAYGINDSELSNERAKAIDYYLGKPFGNELDGRSQVVSTDVADTVEAILPALCKIFLSGDEVVRFDPRGPEDIEAAEQETEVCNHIVMEKNDGFITLYQFFKDALISKNGYVKVYWEDKEEVEKEFYKGLTDDEFAFILKDREVEIVEHDEYPDEADAIQRQEAINSLVQQMQAAQAQDPQAVQQIQAQIAAIQSKPTSMLHDVRIETKETNGCIEIESVAPEAMMISYDTKGTNLQECRFVQHREYCTLDDLREDGFDVPDSAGSEDSDYWQEESLARDLYGEDYDRAILTGPDRRVLVRDTYIRIDGRLMRYVVVGQEIVHEEEVEVIPFACISPVLMPHRHIGRSVADLVSDIQLIKSTLMRGQLDGMFLSLNPRTAISDRVNLDDMLVSRPGGVVRVQGNVGDALMPLVTPDVSQIGYPMLEYMDSVKENRTGVTKYNQGLDANSLNKTATGIQLIQNSAQERIQLIARIFAETGVKELFRLTHRLMRTNSNKEMVVRLRNKFITVDPRTWKNRYDMSIAVGLGTGNRDQQLAHLNNMLQIAMQTSQMGIQLATPKGLYNIVSKLTTNAGFKNPEEFWQDPSTQPPAPPQPNPLIQVEQIKQQGKQQEMQVQAQLDQQKFQANLQQEQMRSQNDVTIEQQKIQAQMELERWKAQLASETELQKAQMQLQAEMAIEQYKAENDAAMALKEHRNELGGMLDKAKGSGDNSSQVLLTGLQAMIQQMNAPKQIVRGPDGRAVGVTTVQ
jgi:hypothetical protein